MKKLKGKGIIEFLTMTLLYMAMIRFAGNDLSNMTGVSLFISIGISVILFMSFDSLSGNDQLKHTKDLPDEYDENIYIVMMPIIHKIIRPIVVIGTAWIAAVGLMMRNQISIFISIMAIIIMVLVLILDNILKKFVMIMLYQTAQTITVQLKDDPEGFEKFMSGKGYDIKVEMSRKEDKEDDKPE